MNSHSSIDANTIRAYEETEYHVFSEAPLTLIVGVRNQSLADLHRAHEVACSAFITAVNPFGVPAGEAANAHRQTTLAAELEGLGFRFIGGVGQHPSGNWPGEPSFLVLGLSLHAAKELGARHTQNAIVWCGENAVPELILLR